jgi:hypothetical protein
MLRPDLLQALRQLAAATKVYDDAFTEAERVLGTDEVPDLDYLGDHETLLRWLRIFDLGVMHGLNSVKAEATAMVESTVRFWELTRFEGASASMADAAVDGRVDLAVLRTLDAVRNRVFRGAA